MSVKLRCERCFAPKDHEDGVCEFCGLDPMEEKAIAKLGDELMEEFLKELEEEAENSLEGLSLDEKIRKAIKQLNKSNKSSYFF